MWWWSNCSIRHFSLFQQHYNILHKACWHLSLCIEEQGKQPLTSVVLMSRSTQAMHCSLTHHVLLSRTVITHRWHAVCFSPFLSACPRLMIQISGVHPDLYRTSPLIQPFSSCHHLVNWSFPDVSSWHHMQTVIGGCGCGITWVVSIVCLVETDKQKL